MASILGHVYLILHNARQLGKKLRQILTFNFGKKIEIKNLACTKNKESNNLPVLISKRSIMYKVVTGTLPYVPFTASNYGTILPTEHALNSTSNGDLKIFQIGKFHPLHTQGDGRLETVSLLFFDGNYYPHGTDMFVVRMDIRSSYIKVLTNRSYF